MRATSSTLFAGMENVIGQVENPKPTRITEFNIQQKHVTHRLLPAPLSLKLSIRHFATNVVMLYSFNDISQCSRYQ